MFESTREFRPTQMSQQTLWAAYIIRVPIRTSLVWNSRQQNITMKIFIAAALVFEVLLFVTKGVSKVFPHFASIFGHQLTCPTSYYESTYSNFCNGSNFRWLNIPNSKSGQFMVNTNKVNLQSFPIFSFEECWLWCGWWLLTNPML